MSHGHLPNAERAVPAPGREVTRASFEARVMALPVPEAANDNRKYGRAGYSDWGASAAYTRQQLLSARHGAAEIAAEADAQLAALRVALIDLLALAKRANEIMLQEAGIGIVDLGAIERADAALATFDRETA